MRDNLLILLAIIMPPAGIFVGMVFLYDRWRLGLRMIVVGVLSSIIWMAIYNGIR